MLKKKTKAAVELLDSSESLFKKCMNLACVRLHE